MAELIANLPAAFDDAVKSGDVHFFPSTVNKHVESDIEFEIRVCPALLHKPQSDPSQKHKDPFNPPYAPKMLLGEVQTAEGNLVLLLNKYAVVPHHLIITTKEYQSQNSPLLPSELAAAYRHLLAAKRGGRTFLGFYNCGPLSGASQPHKHMQLIPVDIDGPPIDRLARKQVLENKGEAFSIAALPYAHFVHRLSVSALDNKNEATESYLGDIYMNLLDLAIATIRRDSDSQPGPPSYNILMTLEHMFIIPRRQEEHKLSQGSTLSVNSLGFAGMFLVKCEEELQEVKAVGIIPILTSVASIKCDIESDMVAGL